MSNLKSVIEKLSKDFKPGKREGCVQCAVSEVGSE